MKTELKLGQTLRDATSGFEGIAVNKTEFLNGTVQYSLQPQAKDGVYPSSISIDQHMLDVVNDGVSSRVVDVTYISPIKLGNEVKCIVSGITGIATLKTSYLNGCAAFHVVTKLENTTVDGSTHAEDWMDQCRLQIVSEGVQNKVVSPPKDSNGRSPGGPVMRNIPRNPK